MILWFYLMASSVYSITFSVKHGNGEKKHLPMVMSGCDQWAVIRKSWSESDAWAIHSFHSCTRILCMCTCLDRYHTHTHKHLYIYIYIFAARMSIYHGYCACTQWCIRRRQVTAEGTPQPWPDGPHGWRQLLRSSPCLVSTDGYWWRFCSWNLQGRGASSI